jgi:hypothetical protein
MKTIKSGLGIKIWPGSSKKRAIKSLRATVHGCACCAILLFAFVLGVAMNGTSAFAAVDKNQADISWLGAGTVTWTAYYADVSDSSKVKSWDHKAYSATSAASPALSHCLKEGGGFLSHYHYQKEFGDSGAPSQADADKYWNARFQMADKVQSAWKQHETCHEWALTQTPHATGTYQYRLSSPYTETANAMTSRPDDSDVEPNDLLQYSGHTTLVKSTRSDGSGGNEPSVIKWKWLDSGIYKYTTTNSHEFSTPYCTGTPAINIAVEDQSWTEDLDYASSPTVYGP